MGRARPCKATNLALVLRHQCRPVLDGADGRHLVEQPLQRRRRIALARGQRILKYDQRQIGRIADGLEMGQHHPGRLAKGEGRRREHQQRRSAAGLGLPRDPRRLQAAVRPDAVNDRQFAADFLARDLHDATLFVARARGDLGRVRVDRDRRQSLHRGDVAQMSAEARLVDREIVVQRQQDGRDHTLGHEIRMAAHVSSPSALFLSFSVVPGRRFNRRGARDALVAPYQVAVPFMVGWPSAFAIHNSMPALVSLALIENSPPSNKGCTPR